MELWGDSITLGFNTTLVQLKEIHRKARGQHDIYRFNTTLVQLKGFAM